MKVSIRNDTCSRCGSRDVRNWQQLSEDDRKLARCQPAASMLTDAERKRLLYCVRCWNIRRDEDVRV